MSLEITVTTDLSASHAVRHHNFLEEQGLPGPKKTGFGALGAFHDDCGIPNRDMRCLS
ncbi:hypothetical protein [Primorskyibacter sp. 2E233]|uniref:hypothetical protein n=1 Tax=Primorskyibacter sp. 2E233 TaxID=3413431 RepID=UPI003BEFC9F1